MTVSRHPEFADRHKSKRHRQHHRGTVPTISAQASSTAEFRHSRSQIAAETFGASSELNWRRLPIYLPTLPFQYVDLVSIPTSDFTCSRRYLLAKATWALHLPHSRRHESAKRQAIARVLSSQHASMSRRWRDYKDMATRMNGEAAPELLPRLLRSFTTLTPSFSNI
jgi:hypothetical protein